MLANQPFKLYIYDLETLHNFFSFAGKFYGDTKVQTFEISSRKNQRTELLSWLSYLESSKAQMVGFNSIGFDYPILHQLLNNPYTFGYVEAAAQAQQIIGSQQYGNSAFNAIRMADRIIPQIDLVKINHFDNANKRTPLKSLQVAMRLESVEDMPVEIGVNLTDEQMDQTLAYNIHDVIATEEFCRRNMHLIEMRKELLDSGVLSGDVLNFSDVKLGSEILVKKIGRAKCYTGSQPKRTLRSSINFNEIILSKISYRTEEFQAVLDWFKQQIIYIGSDNPLPHLEANLGGLDFHFGVGGAHASVESRKYVSDERYVIRDIDVAGMYPSIAIANSFCPEHLGKDFLDAYKQLIVDRKQYKKGTTMNGVLKLAANGVFGNSDNQYSPFYDPRMAKQITVNGQLQILQLAEVLSLIPGVQLIQANTDGITVYMPRNMEGLFNFWKSDWEKQTGLTLEEVDYAKMWIRDVNNYLAITMNGVVKRKGAYWYPETDRDYDGVWNKDFSMMVVQKAVEQCLINDWKPEEVVRLVTDKFDFMIREKTPAGASIWVGDKKQLKTVRYYVSTKGEKITKVMKPKGEMGEYKRKNKLTDSYFNKITAEIGKGVWDERIHTKNKSVNATRTTSLNSKLVRVCNRASDFNWNDLDYDYYVDEIKKLIIGDSK